MAKTKDEQAKGRKKQAVAVHTSEVYCPHAYLILNYQETLNDSEKVRLNSAESHLEPLLGFKNVKTLFYRSNSESNT